MVNSFGGRSLEEITAESTALAKRASDAERSLEEAQRVAAAKTREALQALERAADLAEAFEKEKTARVVAENARKGTAQDLRMCLRRSAKAEEGASVSARALAKSETQLESLTQRLDVLRAANHRLEKRLATSTGTADASAGLGITNVGDRLAAARARLRSLSRGKIGSETGGGGCGCGGDRGKGDEGERAAGERAMRVTGINKKWKEKLREAEARGEMYKSAAEASEIGMQGLVRDKAELQEVNIILGKRLTELPGEAHAEDTKRGENNGKDDPMFANRGGRDGMKGTPTQSAPSDLAAKGRIQTDCSTAYDSKRNPQGNVVCKQFDDAHCVKSPTATPRSCEHANATSVTLVSPPGTQLPHGGYSSELSRPVVAGASTNCPGTRTSTRSYSLAAAVTGNGSPCRHQPHLCLPYRSGSDFGLRPSHHGHPKEGAHELPWSASGGDPVAPSRYPYEQLLTESRQLREDALCAVSEGPWWDSGGGDMPAVGSLPDEPAIRSVPIEVLLRLCERSARGGGTRTDISTVPGNVAEFFEDGGMDGTQGEGVESEGLGIVNDAGAIKVGGAKKLPPGISASLAEQVRVNEFRWSGIYAHQLSSSTLKRLEGCVLSQSTRTVEQTGTVSHRAACTNAVLTLDA